MFDLVAADLDVRERVVSLVPEIAAHDTGEALDDKASIIATIATPAILTMWDEDEADAERRVIGSRQQVIRYTLTIGLIVRSAARRSAPVTLEMALRQKVKAAIHWWKPAWALAPWSFLGASVAGRHADRILSEIRFQGKVHEPYT